MKKLSLIIVLLISLAVSGMAQEQKFIPGWQLGVKGGAAMTIGETNDVFTYLTSPAADLAFGYRFTPLFTLRADFTGWQGKGVSPQPYSLYNYSFNYVQAAVDVVFDFCNMFSKYKPHVANPYIFVGGGGMVMFNNGADVSKLPVDNLYWDGVTGNWVARVGLGIDFRITKLIGIELEFVENMTGDKFNSKKGDVLDHQLQALLGLRFDFGENQNKSKKQKSAAANNGTSSADAAAAAAAVAAVAASADTVAVEPAPSTTTVESVPVATTAVASSAVAASADDSNNIYFQIGKTEIRASQQYKIDAAVKALKADPTMKVTVCGYADKQTGSSQMNLKLSTGRAIAVKDALVKAGIEAERITACYFGDTVQPFGTPVKNRVAIIIK